MAAFKRFEEILAWQKARTITSEIYKATSDGAFSKDFGLRDQIRRSAVSIMANIAEGYGRRTNKEFASFLVIAHASAAESQSHLYVALDLKYIDQKAFDDLYKPLDEVSRMTMSLCQHLRKNP